jgi:hypothetical protein
LADRTYLIGSSPFNSRAVVTWQGAGEPITLTVRGPDGEVEVPLTPVRALELAKELIQRPKRTIVQAFAATAACCRIHPWEILRLCGKQLLNKPSRPRL